MRLHDGIDMRRLLNMLHKDLDKEKEWNPALDSLKMGVSGAINLAERNTVCRWLLAVNTAFGFYKETFSLGIALLDRFLLSIKVHARYLRCIAASCLYIAAKVVQEDEAVPASEDFVNGSNCDFSGADLRRMELAVLDKLGWCPLMPTPLSFLHIFHSLLLTSNPQLAGAAARSEPGNPAGERRLMANLIAVSAGPLGVTYRPSTLALAVLSLHTQTWAPESWLTPLLGLLALAKIPHKEAAVCRDAVALQIRRNLPPAPSAAPPTPKRAPSTPLPQPRTPKRKAHEIELDDDVYECIKRLYHEEGGGGACGHHRTPASCSADTCGRVSA